MEYVAITFSGSIYLILKMSIPAVSMTLTAATPTHFLVDHPVSELPACLNSSYRA